MVAPVVTEGATSREVYLPKGKDWIDWWTGKRYAGNQTITVAAPLDVMPIFVAQGSVVPTREVQQHTGQNEFTNVAFNVFLGNASSATGTLYEDDGKSEKYKDGEWNSYSTTVTRNADGSIGTKIEKTHTGYASKLASYDLVLRGTDLGGFGIAAKAKASSIKVDDERSSAGVTIKKVDAKAGTVTISVPLSTDQATIAFEGK
jgi:alpha-glucosidase